MTADPDPAAPLAERAPHRSSVDGPRFRYRANGLTLLSELELPELQEGNGEPDVHIRFGEVPAELDRVAARGPRCQVASGEYLLEVRGVARFWVRDGSDVVVAPFPEATEDDLRVFILSSVMGALAHQNGFLPVHASAIEIAGSAVLFAGESGSGKSTVAAAFVARGYRLVADDICAISLDAQGTPRVHSGYRHLKLWADALERVGGMPRDRRRLRRGMDKYSVLLDGGSRPAHLGIRRIFVLGLKLADGLSLKPLRGRAKMAALLRETYRFRLIGGLGRRDEHFGLCEALGRHVPVTVVERPLYLSRLDELVTALEEDLIVGSEGSR